jgi:predicted permease
MGDAEGPKRFLRLPTPSSSRIQHEIDDELAFHLDMRVRELQADGLTETAARAEAIRRFGDLQDARRYCHMIDSSALRRERRRGYASDAWNDLQWTMRQMRRTPAFTLLAVLTLAAGIGSATAMFSVVNRLLIDPLPFPGGDRIVLLVRQSPTTGMMLNPSPELIRIWRDGVTSFEAVGALAAHGPAGQDRARLGSGPDQLNLQAGSFEPAIARMLRMRPALGRWFADDEGRAGAPAVAMLGFGLWQRHYGASPDVAGRVVTLDDIPHTIVGVVPREFELPFLGSPAEGKEIWTPLQAGEAGGVNAIAWLRPGATEASANREMTALMRSEGTDRFSREFEAKVLRPQDILGKTTQDMLLVTLGAVAVLLFIACTNVANLLLARAVSRRRELAIRTAVGAGRGRLVRQLVTESALLAAAGGVVGLLIAWQGLRAIVALRPDNLSSLDRVQIDPMIVGGALIAGVLTGVIFGLAPALLATGRGVGDALRGGASSGGHPGSTRVRSGLVVLEVALSVVLLVGAGLLVRSFRALQSVDIGVDAHGLMSVHLTLPEGRYPTPESRAVVLEEIRMRLLRVVGVRSASLAMGLPAASGVSFGALRIDGVELTDSIRTVGYNAVSPDFFRLVGLRLRQGTTFAADTSLRQVVINASMAARYWPGRSAIGERVSMTGALWLTVVGVADDVALPGATGPIAAHQLYHRHTPYYDGAAFVLRVGDDAPGLAARLTSAVEDGTGATMYDTQSMDDVIERRFVRPRFAMALLSTFALIALVVASVGLYGVIAYAVTRRTREMGIRLALGAHPAAVRRLVVVDGARLAVTGIFIGLLSAAAGARVMQSLLFGIEPVDLATFVAVALVLGLVTVIASYVPARRATRVDPMIAVQAE